MSPPVLGVGVAILATVGFIVEELVAMTTAELVGVTRVALPE